MIFPALVLELALSDVYLSHIRPNYLGIYLHGGRGKIFPPIFYGKPTTLAPVRIYHNQLRL